MNQNSPILITGCPRSGTSMVAGIFHICGAYKGHVDKMNENILIREGLVKNFLRKINMDPDGRFPLLNRYPVGYPELWNEMILETINKQSDANQIWFYKDCRSALLWYLWLLSFPKSIWVIVRRNEKDILESCQKTGYMKTFNDDAIKAQINVETTEEGWRWMLNEYLNRFNKIKRAFGSCQVFEVWPEKMMENNYAEIKTAIDACGLTWNEDEVKQYIEPKIFRRTII